MRIVQKHFVMLRGQPITSYTLINDNGMEVACLDYGCLLTKIAVPAQRGCAEKLVLDMDFAKDYIEYPWKWSLGDSNVGNFLENQLFGRLKELDKAIWRAEIKKSKEEAALIFSYWGMDEVEGYLGNVRLEVLYKLTNQNELILSLKIDGMPNPSYPSKTEEKYCAKIELLSLFNKQQAFH